MRSDLAIRLIVVILAGLIAALLAWGITALGEADESPSLPAPIPTDAA